MVSYEKILKETKKIDNDKIEDTLDNEVLIAPSKKDLENPLGILKNLCLFSKNMWPDTRSGKWIWKLDN